LARRGRSARLRPEIIPSSGRQSPFSRGGDLLVPGFPSVPLNAHTPSADPAAAPPAAPARLSWARLLKRVFNIDIEHCPHWGGPLKIIAAPSTGSGQASNIPPSLRRSSPTSACPPAHRPDRPRAHSIDSKRPDPSPRPRTFSITLGKGQCAAARSRMREGRGGILFVADTRSRRNSQKDTPSLRQVFLRLAKVSRQRRPRLLRVPPLTFRFLT
jgi:hypothetical protein